jgi:hypothetical protein
VLIELYTDMEPDVGFLGEAEVGGRQSSPPRSKLTLRRHQKLGSCLHHGKVEDMPPYFLGSIVLIKAEPSPSTDVVDGQQRLTTLTLLLSARRQGFRDIVNYTCSPGDHFELISAEEKRKT